MAVCEKCGADVLTAYAGSVEVLRHAVPPKNPHYPRLLRAQPGPEACGPLPGEASLTQDSGAPRDAPKSVAEAVPRPSLPPGGSRLRTSARQTGAPGGSRSGAGDGPVSTDPRRVILEEEIELGMT